MSAPRRGVRRGQLVDDSAHNIDSARLHVAAGHVPHGVANPD
ncbi:hypothetical protein [Pseudoxanthomonas kaohsiungensis]